MNLRTALNNLASLALVFVAIASVACAVEPAPEPITTSLVVGGAAAGFGAWRKRRNLRK